MDPLENPYRPGAGTAPPAMLGRDELIDAFGVTIRRALDGRPGKSYMPIGLRGVGKTVLLNRFTEIATDEGMHVAYIEAPETGDFRTLLAGPAAQGAPPTQRQRAGQAADHPGPRRAALVHVPPPRRRVGVDQRRPDRRRGRLRDALRRPHRPARRRRPGRRRRPHRAARGDRRGAVPLGGRTRRADRRHPPDQPARPARRGRRRRAAPTPRARRPGQVVRRTALRLPDPRHAHRRRRRRRAGDPGQRPRRRLRTRRAGAHRRAGPRLPLLPAGVGLPRVERGARVADHPRATCWPCSSR